MSTEKKAFSHAEIDPGKRALTLLEEFKNFALKGNVVDLAVGVVIGAAFGKIVESLVKNIFMPTIGLLMPSNQGYLEWKITVGEKSIPYGLFLGEVLNFLIVTMALFLFIRKFLGFILHSRREQAAQPPKLTKDQELLSEIRDLLKQGRGEAASS
jgi:large conductance mechanosensitive channel